MKIQKLKLNCVCEIVSFIIRFVKIIGIVRIAFIFGNVNHIELVICNSLVELEKVCLAEVTADTDVVEKFGSFILIVLGRNTLFDDKQHLGNLRVTDKEVVMLLKDDENIVIIEVVFFAGIKCLAL